MRLMLAWAWAGLLALALEGGRAAAQTPNSAASKLARVLPADAAERVLRRVEDLRARGLPAAALEQRALELAAKGVPPDRIARAIDEHAGRLDSAWRTLSTGGRSQPAPDEIEAAATALQEGLRGSALADFAGSAPSSRSLAVPLLVIASLLDRGMPADAAVPQVLARVRAHASNQQLAVLASPQGISWSHAASLVGRDLVATRPPSDLGPLGMAGAITTGTPPAIPGRPPRPTRP